MYKGKSVLLCGNGPSLLAVGQDIPWDQYDYIMRMNNWEANGTVGHRCDIWLTSCNWDIIFLPKYRDCHVWAARWPCVTVFESLAANLEICRIPMQLTSFLTKLPELFVSRQIYNSILAHNFVPSTGVVGIAMALEEQMDVTIAGFDHFLAPSHHYFTDKVEIIGEAYHEGQKEKMYVSNLIANGKLKQLKK